MTPQITEPRPRRYVLVDADTGEKLTKEHWSRFRCYMEYRKKQEVKKCVQYTK